MSSPQVLYDALAERTGAEVINEERKERQLRFMLRVKKGRNTTVFLAIVEALLATAEVQLAQDKPAWTIDISKQYHLRPDLRYGWRVILQGADLNPYFDLLANAVRSAQVKSSAVNSGGDYQEIRLRGSPNRRAGVPVKG